MESPLPESMPPEPYGLFYSWWRGDPLPPIETPRALEIRLLEDASALEQLSGLTTEELNGRMADGHRPWLASVAGAPAGWGWLATRHAFIGGLDVSLELPDENRYLWDFATLPEWRGQRIYPALIQAMLRTDADATRFWIGHDLANQASRRGILRAGVGKAGAVHATSDGELIYVPRGLRERAVAGAALLGLPMAETPAS
jgi:hypothetical protein